MNSRGTDPRDFQSRALPGYAISAWPRVRSPSFNAHPEHNGTEKPSNGPLQVLTMAGVSEAAAAEKAEHRDLRLRLSELDLKPIFPTSFPLAAPMERLRKEWTFIALLSTKEERRDAAVTVAIGMFAFLLGALGPEILNGGRPDLVGMTSVSGAAYVQTLAGFAMWCWFAVRLWIAFPVMRVHALTMFACWGLMMGGQLLFHLENADFPQNLTLSQLSTGALLTVVSVFMLYMLGTAVRETRDMHVEEFHVHEDVRKMTEEMEEHSLFGWGGLYLVWFILVLLNAWTGAHFIADRHADRWIPLTVHVLSAPFILVLLMAVAWFPQRMLGQGAQVRTKAARMADEDLRIPTAPAQSLECPSCHLASEDLRPSGSGVEQRCFAAGCGGWGRSGTSYSSRV